MKKTLFSFLLIPWIYSVQAQHVVNSSGKSISDASRTIEYSIGETVVSTIQTPNRAVTQGLLQPRYSIETSINEDFDSKFDFKVFPNPTTDNIVVETNYKKFDSYNLFSIEGKLIENNKYNYQPIDLSKLPSGVYQLQLYSPLFFKSIKIIKQ